MIGHGQSRAELVSARKTCTREPDPARATKPQWTSPVEAFLPGVHEDPRVRRLKLSCRQQLSSRRTYDGRRTRNSRRHILRRLLRRNSCFSVRGGTRTLTTRLKLNG